MRNRRAEFAFTLLEIMLAVTILALVIAAVYSTWSAGLAGWKRSASVTENLQRERVILDTLADLTQSAVFFRSDKGLYAVEGKHEAQTGDSISFVTGSDSLLPQTEIAAAGMRRVTIMLGRDQRGRAFLGMSNQPALAPDKAPDPVLHVLSADVCGLGIRYRDPRSVAWVDKWEEQSIIPSAIEYTIAFGANDGRTPPVVVTRTVELPAAQYSMMAAGSGNFGLHDTTNTVSRQDIPLSTSGEVMDNQ
jgi:type II secretory pathway pseudopilin PulG